MKIESKQRLHALAVELISQAKSLVDGVEDKSKDNSRRHSGYAKLDELTLAVAGTFSEISEELIAIIKNETE